MQPKGGGVAHPGKGEVGGREVRDAVPVQPDPLERAQVSGEGALPDRPDPAVAQLEAHEGRQAGEGKVLKIRDSSKLHLFGTRQRNIFSKREKPI